MPQFNRFLVVIGTAGFLLRVLTETVYADNELHQKLSALIAAHPGHVAVAVRNLESGESFTHRANIPMPTASLIKFAVMVESYRQAEQEDLDLDATVTLSEQDKVPGSGILTKHFSPGARLAIRDAIRLMIAYSDNSATNLVLDKIGISSVAETMKRMGFPKTRIYAKVYRRDTSIDPSGSQEFGLGSTTASEMVGLYKLLHQRKLISKQACEEMLAHLFHCEDRSKLARFLPSDTEFAHKTGAVGRVSCDAGIIESPAAPIAVCVLTNRRLGQTANANNSGSRLSAEIGKIVYDHFNPQRLTSQPSVVKSLHPGATGSLVEALQRTLNARLSPSPGLTIDGDFGPNTQKALLQFQDTIGLATSGIVTTETWQALGALVTADPPVPPPHAINSAELAGEAADSLWGPPFVTCKAWAIGDGATGKLLWGDATGQALDFASTTKMMTAYVVVKLAERDARMLEEIVTFSQRADQTRGSTSGIRAGEQLSVRELLYGLMLPSGNDASIALAEHFGPRFQSVGDEKLQEAARGEPEHNGQPAAEAPPARTAASPDTTTDVARFIAQMNRTATELGMGETNYVNPHGLTANGHKSSARDLLRLACVAMQSQLFRHYVATRQHGSQLIGAGGYQRNVVWKNTNRLLKTEGYQGIKTGTTSAAGACLVSFGERCCDKLIVIVLGSQSSAARYTDTRNLYRWAWLNRGHR